MLEWGGSLILCLVGLSVALESAAWAQPAPPRVMRHEYVSPVLIEQLNRALTGQTTIEPRGANPLPRAIRRDGARLPAPSARGPSGTRFSDLGPEMDADAIPRPSRMRPDRKTTADRALTYHALFNPTVAPLRRDVAFDRVAPDYELSVASGGRTPIEIKGPQAVPGRELFWGDVVLTSRPNRASPIPSVAPDMRILAVRTEPDRSVRFFKDRADNFYVQSDRRGALRVVFLVDADSRYFSGDLTDTVVLGTNGRHPLTALPRRVRSAAQRVLEQLGVDERMSFATGMARLVGYFRSFTAGPPPAGAREGDICSALALGRLGVCRHRAFAFVITARGAGVPARYVQNEAHAFAEVWAPDGSWRRVDLGGEAPRVDLKEGSKSDSRRLHRPPPDAFPKPSSYLESYSSQLAGGEGASRAMGRGPEGTVFSGLVPPLGSSAPPGSANPDVEADLDPGAALTSSPQRPTSGADALGDSMGNPMGNPPSFDTSDADRDASIRVELEDSSRELDVFRGELLPFAVAGRVTRANDGTPVVGARVQIQAVPLSGGGGVPVGPIVRSDSAGRFVVRVLLPPTLRLGRYRLTAVGDVAP